MRSPNRILAEVYFITTTVIDWVDIFSRPTYKHIALDSLAYCQREKGLTIYAWVLMSNHLHAIVSADGTVTLPDIMRDFKKFTSKRALEKLETDLLESRREWMLDRFRFAARNDSKVKSYRLWQDGYYPELIYSFDFFLQKINYLHDNPARQEIVSRPEEYRYSSAIDYAGGKGLLDVVVVG